MSPTALTGWVKSLCAFWLISRKWGPIEIWTASFPWSFKCRHESLTRHFQPSFSAIVEVTQSPQRETCKLILKQLSYRITDVSALRVWSLFDIRFATSRIVFLWMHVGELWGTSVAAKDKRKTRRRRIKVKEGGDNWEIYVACLFLRPGKHYGISQKPQISNSLTRSKLHTDSTSNGGIDWWKKRQNRWRLWERIWEHARIAYTKKWRDEKMFAYFCACVCPVEDRQSSSDHQAEFLEKKHQSR